MAKQKTPDTTAFGALGLSQGALDAIKRLGYIEPTPIQSQAIPLALDGSDVIAAAETGTGKTAAFLLPLLSSLKKSKKSKRAPRVLVVSPTRELAEQIAKTAYVICRSCGLFTVCLFGGQPYGPQIKALQRGCDVVVATPGRLCDLMDKGSVDLSKIEALVLDEADRMLDMGFLHDVKRIVSATPDDRQTLLFSATIDEGIKRNFIGLLKDPKTIQIASHGKTSELVDQYILPVSQKEKPELLKCLLDEKGHSKVIVFVRTKSRVDGVAKMLDRAGYDVAHIHSNRTQGQRKAALSDFKKGKVDILVATDVLARGIDIPSVEYVVNYDLPDMPEDYIHRIGRTGRAGEIGFAVSFVTNSSLKALDGIERLTGKEIPVMRISSYDVDLQILKPRSRQGHPKKRLNIKKGSKASRDQHYDYEGWGDIRYGKKDRKKGSSKKAGKNASSKEVDRPSSGKKGAGRKKADNGNKRSNPKKARPSQKRPGFKSSGLARKKR